MSAYSTEVISAHQIAMNFTSLLYMIPLSIAMGATILVGHEVGAKRYKDARTYSWLSVGTAVFFSFISSSILFIFREPIASIYTDDQHVIALLFSFSSLQRYSSYQMQFKHQFKELYVDIKMLRLRLSWQSFRIGLLDCQQAIF